MQQRFLLIIDLVSYFSYSWISRVLAYLDSVVGEKYYYIREIDNAQDEQAIAIINEEKVGHIPIYISKFLNMFLTQPGSHLEAEVTGKRVSSGGGKSLEAPCNCCQ